jgi:hypothetical protein
VSGALELAEQLLGAFLARKTWYAADSSSVSNSSAPSAPFSDARKPGWPKAARSARDRSLSASSRCRPGALASCAAPASRTLVAGSSSPDEASSTATQLRRSSAASSAAVQPVQPARPPGHVDGGQHRDRDGEEDVKHPGSPRRRHRPRAAIVATLTWLVPETTVSYTRTTSRATTGQS